MKRLNFIVLLSVLVGSLCLDSCVKDDDEKNGFFYKEPEVEWTDKISNALKDFEKLVMYVSRANNNSLFAEKIEGYVFKR